VDWWQDSYVWWLGCTPRSWRERGGDPWELCARNWVEELAILDEGLREVPPERIFRVRYEDLVASPLPTLERIAAFVGFGPSERWRRELSAISFADRNDAWRSALDPTTARRITEIQRPVLLAEGYEP
jgi:hypothetical protein